ncbi:MAG: TAT-variant-translocated molybdopterin oxidoreductase [Bacteroidia bacterium]
MANTRKYWKGFEQLKNDPEFVQKAQNEFAEEIPLDAFLGNEKLSDTNTSRRDFLKFLGFSVTAASLAACEAPVIKSIPYLNKPEEIIPGIANWYATSYYDGNDFASILVKTREGRPIHIKPNKATGLTLGGINARINSSVLSLYDGERLKGPKAKGEDTTWEKADAEISSELNKIANEGGQIRVLTNTIISPSTKQAIGEFLAKYPTAKHITYDTISYSAIRKANENSFGKAVIPSYDFSKAKVIVSVGADFLSGWLNSVVYAPQYAKTRKPDGEWMSRHFQFETNLSLSGANADVRVPVKPSEQGKVVLALYNAIAAKAGLNKVNQASLNEEVTKIINKAADELWAAKGASLVVAGSNDINVQTLVNAINAALSNYGSTIDLNNALLTKQGNDKEVVELVKEMNAGTIKALFIYGVNPVYSLPNGNEFEAGLAKVKLSVSFADRVDETASNVHYILPDNHYLESWNDYQPSTNLYALAQPTISPLFNTRQAQQTFLKLAGNNTDFYSYIKSVWEKTVFNQQSNDLVFESFWNTTLHNGGLVVNNSTANEVSFNGDVNEAASKIASIKGGDFELALYIKEGMGDGQQANNPWLQEFPDPISRVSWDNYATMSPKQMEEMGMSLLERGDYMANVVEVTVNGKSIKIPAYPQPGQAYGTVGIALGYGRTKVGKAGNNVGQNAFPFISINGECFDYDNYSISVSKTDEKHEIAATQTHHTMMGREIVKETTLSEYKKDPKSGNSQVLLATHKGMEPVADVNIWNEHPVEHVGHRWGLAIDLNTCIGCGACVTACHSENNVPVVGKEEVRRSRDMHWLRIDRYYTSDMTKEKGKEEGLGQIEMYSLMERASENPQVAFQPVMCQHCNHASCETVCPVAATTHSNEGLNQMAYNRCIGTRYCANNCAYKVRRFNWFNYIGNSKFADVNPSQDDLGRMVLNPDVVVRSRGVMEKCTMCVQNIQAGKLKAKKEGRKVVDGDIETACSAACPTHAIIFGDLNDKGTEVSKGSKVSERAADPRAYILLEEVGTKPNVYYLTKVRNTEENLA